MQVNTFSSTIFLIDREQDFLLHKLKTFTCQFLGNRPLAGNKPSLVRPLILSLSAARTPERLLRHLSAHINPSDDRERERPEKQNYYHSKLMDSRWTEEDKRK